MAGAGERRLSGLRSSVVSQKPSHVLENESEKIIRACSIIKIQHWAEFSSFGVIKDDILG